MGIIRNILIAILVISLITFVALFGRLPALRKTPIGWLQRALCLHIPNTLKALDRNVTGGKLSVKGKKLGHYLFFQKNPIVLVSLQKTPRIQAAFDNLFSDSISLHTLWKCCLVPLPWRSSATNVLATPQPSIDRTAVHLHLSLRCPHEPLPRAANQASTPVPVRSHPLPTSPGMPYLQHTQASPQQALLVMQHLRCQTRPPLSVGQQLSRPG